VNKHYDQLKELLSSDKEDVLVINQGRVNKHRNLFKAVVFDFDGVLLRENNLAERGYAWLIRSLRDGNYDPRNINVSAYDIGMATAFRSTIKGAPMKEKVKVFKVVFGKGDLKIPVEKLVRLWFDALKNNVLSQFANNPNNYRMPGAKELLETTDSKCSIAIYGVTANEFQHAYFLMELVGFKDYFSEIVGFPINSFPHTSKASLLSDLLFRHYIKPMNAVYIGDGTSDIKAGKRAGAFTIGIANASMPVSLIEDPKEKKKIIEKSIKNGMKLIDEGCDLLATSTLAYKKIVAYF